jgi:hypothetical protein
LKELTGIRELILNGEHVKDPINNEHLLWKIGEIGMMFHPNISAMNETKVD